LQLDANECYFRVNTFQIGDILELAYFGRAKGTGIEAVFTCISIAFLATALPFNLCWDYSQSPENLTYLIWFIRFGKKDCERIYSKIRTRLSKATFVRKAHKIRWNKNYE